jgi:hypothetical protein
MSSSPLEQKKKMASEFLYQQLVSTEKSEENAAEFLRMELRKRKANLAELRKISDYFGEAIATEMENKSSNLSQAEKSKITKECLEKAYKRWNKENEE